MSNVARLSGLTLALAFAATTLGAQSSAPRTLQLTFNADRTVTLTAANVTVREILAEWARQCGCYVVNADKLTSGPLLMPVQYEREPQAKVLESLLRQAAGYVLTPKRDGSATASNYETIYILATSSPVAGAYVPPPAAPMPAMPMPTAGSPEDEIPSVLTAPPGQAPTGPPRPGMPTPMPSATGAPGGVQAPTRPGMPGVFVPIVPITSTPATPTTPAPGMPTGVPQTGTTVPVPIVPVPQQGR